MTILVAAAAVSGTGLALAAGPTGGSGAGTLPPPGDKRADRDATAPHAFLVELDVDSTATAAKRGKTAARTQLARVEAAQDRAVAALPRGARPLYRTHAVMAGVAVHSREPGVAAKLAALPGAVTVHPISTKHLANSSSMPLQGAPAAWAAPLSATGEGVTIAVIDSGIDYTHANFGGPGTQAAYTAAKATGTAPADPAYFGPAAPKVIGGYDFVGDDYKDDDPAHPAQPDPNPLDCAGHGSHVAGTAAGFGENADGSTYTGGYGAATPFGTMRIGPGMAPRAKLYAYRVYGCNSSTKFVGAAIDKAVDPNGDGNPADHVDVMNLSLGSSFGPLDDADAVLLNRATELGVSTVAAVGNDGDTTDIGGTPANAARAIAVASTQDASTRFDGLHYAVNGATQPPAATVRTVAYDWTTKPDIAGPVVVAPPANAQGCAPFDANSLAGKVVLLDFVTPGGSCGTTAASGNATAAGAIGVVFANPVDDNPLFLNGSATIPGVHVGKTVRDQMRSAIAGALPVQVTATSVSTVNVNRPEMVDRVSTFSSRGIRDAGNLKPDVGAVGETVFSTGVGTGTEGADRSGTSMATPAVAGLAALVRGKRPTWTPAEVKAAIVNTAGQDVDTNGSATAGGDKYAPVRVGTGRIKAADALTTTVLASSAEDAGVASVGFGPIEVSGPMTRTKRITVANKGPASATYDVAYQAITSVPGVDYVVSPAQVTVAPGSTQTVDVTFTVTDASLLSRTVDPTIGRSMRVFDYPREALAEASGRVVLTSLGGAPSLRVAVHSSPRPAADMTQAGTLEIFGGNDQTASLPLTGRALGQAGSNGSGNADPDDDIYSYAAGFEHVRTSGDLPDCGSGGAERCIAFSTDLGGDVRHVGYTSDFPVVGDVNTARAYFAITARGAASIPQGRHYTSIVIDVDEDGGVDWFINVEHLPRDDDQEDVFVAALYRADGTGFSSQDIDGRDPRYDRAVYDSDVVFLPVALKDLAEAADKKVTAADPRVRFAVITRSRNGRVLDSIGYDPATSKLTGDAMGANLYAPGVHVRHGTNSPLFDDTSDVSVTVKRNMTEYRADNAQGLLMLHLHNKVGAKAQVVTLRGKLQTVAFTSTAPATAAPRDTYTPTGTGGPSGKPVTFSTTTPAVCTAAGGVVTFVAEGTCTVQADQAGDDDHEPAPPVTQSIGVAKVAQAVAFTSSAPGDAKVGGTYTAAASGGESGKPVTFSSATAETCTVAGATVSFTAAGACTVAADQEGDDRFAAAPRATQSITVAPAGGGGGGGGGGGERAATATALTAAPAALTATVSAAQAGLGFPSGTVSFSVDGTTVGTAPVLAGIATLAHKTPTGATRKLVATYSGDTGFLPSAGAVDRADPVVKTSVKSAKKRTRFGWYRTPVTVSFTCTPRGAALTAACPRPVTVSRNAAKQSVSRTVSAADGGATTARVSAINIDRKKPTVRITIVRGKPKCVARDPLSKLAGRCKLGKRGARWTATATDKAGNRATASKKR